MKFIASLRAHLLIIVVLCSTPAFLLLVWQHREQKRIAEEGVRRDALNLAQHAAAEHADALRSSRQLLLALSQTPELTSADSQRCSSFAGKLIAIDSRYTNIGVVDRRGDLICSGLPPTQPLNFANRAWFQRARNSRSFAVGDYSIGSISGKGVLVFSLPLVDNGGNADRILFVSLNLASVQLDTRPVQLPPNVVIAIVDESGTIVAQSPDGQRFVGKRLPEALTHAASGRVQGTAEGRGLDGLVRLYGFVPLSDLPKPSVFLWVGIPRDQAFAAVDRQLKQGIAWLGAAALLLFAFGWVASELLLVRNLQTVMAAVRRVAAGDLSSRAALHKGPAELRQIGRVFDDMAATLERRERERNDAEATARDYLERFEIVARVTNDVLWDWDLATDRLWLSAGIHSVLGYDLEQVAPENDWWLQRVHPEDRARVSARLKTAMEGIAGLWFDEYRFRRASGSYADIADRGLVLRDADGRAFRMIGAVLDVTARKSAESSLHAAAEQYRLLFDRNPLPMWVYDCETLAFLNVNDAAVRHYGYSREEFLGMTIRDIRPAEDIPRLLESVASNQWGRVSHESAWTHLKKDGSAITVEITSESMLLNGRTVQLVLAHDVTARVAAEAELRQSRHWLASAVAAADIALWESDLRTGVFTYSPEWARQLGHVPEEISTGINEVYDRTHPDDLAAVRTAANTLRHGTQDAFEQEFRLRHKDGSYRWMLSRGSLLRAADGTPERVFGCHIDITERKQAEDTLRRSEASLALAQQMARIGNWEQDLVHGDLVWSDQVYRIFGFPPETFVPTRESFFSRVHPEDQDGVRTAVAHALETGEPYEAEHRIILEDDSIRYVHEHARITYRNGVPAKLTGTVQDVTERRLAEDSLRASEERYRVLVANSQALICTHTLDGVLLSVNETAARVLGLPTAAVLGTPMASMIAPRYQQDFGLYLKAIGANGHAEGLMRVVTASGAERIWLYRNVLFHEPGKQPYVIGNALDVTDWKRAEKSQAQLVTILDATTDFVGTSGPSGDVLYVNRGGRSLLGIPEGEDLKGRTISDFHPEWALKLIFETGVPTAIRSGSWSGDTALVHRDGREIPVSQVILAHKRSNGTVEFLSTIARDASQRIAAEEELRRYAARLHDLTKHLESVREAERTRIAREIHDVLGQYLTALRMDLDWVSGKVQGGSIVHERLGSALELVDATVLTVRRIASELRPGVLDLGLGAAIEWQAEDFQTRTGIPVLLDNANVEDIIALPAERATGLFRIFQEALTNVYRHSNATEVKVRVWLADDVAALEVTDNGRGFDLEAALHHRSLGLLGMRERAELLQGQLTVETRSGSGTTIRATVPLSAGQLQQEPCSRK